MSAPAEKARSPLPPPVKITALTCRVGFHLLNGLVQLLKEVNAHGVEHLGPIEGIDANAFMLLHDDVLVSPGSTPNSPIRCRVYIPLDSSSILWYLVAAFVSTFIRMIDGRLSLVSL